MSFVFFFSIVLSLACAVLSVDLECDKKSDREADEEFSKLIAFTNPHMVFPETDENYKVFCVEYNERVRILSNYVKKCKKGLPKQLLSVIMYTIRLQVKNLCKNSSKSRDALLGAGKCVNAGKPQFRKCNNEIIDNLLGIIKVDHKKKIPMTCCTYYKYVACFQTRGQGVKECSADHLDVITDFIESVANNALSLLCGDYVDGSDKCSKLEAPPPREKGTKRPKSFFMPFIQVFNSFPEITVS